MIQRQTLPTQAEIGQGVARARQLCSQAFAAAFARLGARLAAALARLAAPAVVHRGRPA